MKLSQIHLLNQWTKTEHPNMRTHNFSHLIFDKDSKIVSSGQESIFNN